MSQEECSEALIEVLKDLDVSDIGFVFVSGYAISQLETRFSADLDLVIAPDDYERVVIPLEVHQFEWTDELEIPPEETIYNRDIEFFRRTEDLFHPAGVDVSGRQTDLADVLTAVPEISFQKDEAHLHRSDEDALWSQLCEA